LPASKAERSDALPRQSGSAHCGIIENRAHEAPRFAEQTMILEVADIRITAGQQAAFEEAIQRGVRNVISQARGYRSHRIEHGIESPERYLLMIVWDTLENHTVDFRQSEAFAAWRAIVGPFFASPPQVEHFTLVDGDR
jgi:heme-degrading monooxygenase HmoA